MSEIILVLYISVFFFPLIILPISSFVLGLKTKKIGLNRIISWAILMAVITPICLLLLQITTFPLCGFPDSHCSWKEFNIEIDIMDGFNKSVMLVLFSLPFLYLGVLTKHKFLQKRK